MRVKVDTPDQRNDRNSIMATLIPGGGANAIARMAVKDGSAFFQVLACDAAKVSHSSRHPLQRGRSQYLQLLKAPV